MNLRDALTNFLADRGYGQPALPRSRPRSRYSWIDDYLLRAILLLVVLPAILIIGGIFIWFGLSMILSLTFGH